MAFSEGGNGHDNPYTKYLAAGVSIRELGISTLAGVVKRTIQETVYIPESTLTNGLHLDPRKIDFAGVTVIEGETKPSGFNGQDERLVFLVGDENAVRRAEISFFVVPPERRMVIN